jgi:hypothetical protein
VLKYPRHFEEHLKKLKLFCLIIQQTPLIFFFCQKKKKKEKKKTGKKSREVGDFFYYYYYFVDFAENDSEMESYNNGKMKK